MHESPRLDSELLRIVTEIKSDVSAIRERQEQDHNRLFGNGQPGELTKLDGRIRLIELERAEQKGEQSSNHKWTAAIGSICGIVAGAVAGWLAKHFG